MGVMQRSQSGWLWEDWSGVGRLGRVRMERGGMSGGRRCVEDVGMVRELRGGDGESNWG